MKKIWIATSNAHKVEEFQKMLGEDVQVCCLKDLDQEVEIVENGKTFEENALIKARSLYDVLNQPVISDDSGLEVDAMDKAPGVYSARWMGEDTSYDVKNAQIIKNVEGKNRTARFVCVIAYIDENGKGHTYRGEVEGQINDKILGATDLDMIQSFIILSSGTTLANVSSEMKNKVSHRSRALEKIFKRLEK